MQAISASASERLRRSSSMLAKATVTLSDGSKLDLTGSDLKGMSYEQSTSSDRSFDIGGAVVGKLTLTLENFDHRFDGVDFTGAGVVPYVGVALGPTSTEWVRKGSYAVDQPDAYGDEVQLTCYDILSLLSRVPYSDVKTVYPTYLGKIIQDCCESAGITFGVDDDSVSRALDYEVPVRPSGTDRLSALQVAAYAAQAAGCFLRSDNASARIVAGWYDIGAFEGESWLDGGTYETADTPYSDGDVADGGTFGTTTTPYSDGTRKDGGTFDGNQNLAVIVHYKSLTVGTDDAVVTGIQVTAQNEVVVGSDGKEQNGRDGETALAGNKGYVLSVSGNPLVLYGQASSVAHALYSRIGGMRFRRYTVDALPDPSIEPGDPIVLQDRLSRVYRSYVTSVSLTVNGSMTLKCGGATPARNSSASASASTQAVVAARNELKRERTSREIAQSNLQSMIDESGGLYQTKETQSDGSTVYYLHDKPTVAASKTVWKMTASAFGVSTDGGKTYSTGLTAQGNAILNRIYAIGLDATHITAGTISDKYGYNRWNLGTGEFSLAATAKVGGQTVSSIANDAVNAQTQQSVFNKLTNNGQTQGIYLSGGKLYINATYMKAGTISDSSGKNSWNLSTGYLSTTYGKIGGFTISSASIYNDIMFLDSSGLSLKYTYGGTTKKAGLIGVNSYHGDASRFGLNFDLEYDADYMTWAWRETSSSDTYEMKWTYASKSLGSFSADTLSAGCDIDMRNHTIKNIGNGVTQTVSGVLPTSIGSGGVVTNYYSNLKLVFVNGICTQCWG